MVYITAVHLEGGTAHEHISSVKWQNTASNTSGQTTRAQMVEFINDGNAVRVTDGRTEVPVQVVDAKPPHLRTKADGRWTNNLLALPRY